jgi:hypothetical protein
MHINIHINYNYYRMIGQNIFKIILLILNNIELNMNFKEKIQ